MSAPSGVATRVRSASVANAHRPVSHIRTLYGNSFDYLVGVAGVMLLGFISFPLFTRILSVSQYGLLNLVMKVLLMVAVLSKMGLQHSVIRFHQEYRVSPDPNALQRYYSTLFFGSMGTAVFMTLLFVVGLWSIPVSLISQGLKYLLLFGAVYIVITTMNQLLAGFLRAAGQTKSYATLQIVVKAVTIAVIVLLLFEWERSIRALLTGTIAVETVAVIILTASLLNRRMLSVLSFDTRSFRTVLLFGLPMILFELSAMILDSGDRILIQHFLGATPLGYYSAAYNVSAYCQELIQGPLNLALVPLYVRLWTTRGKAETQAFLTQTLDDFLIVAVAGVAAAVVCARDILVLLASAKYQQAARLVPVLVVGLMLYTVVTFFYAGLYLQKRTRTMALLVFSACVLNMVLNLILLPRIGIMGAVYATLISYAFLVFITVRASRVVLAVSVRFGGLVRYLAAGAGAVACTSWLHFAKPFVNVASKGSLTIVIYGILLWCLDQRFRRLVSRAVEMVYGRGAGSSLSPVQHEVDPAEKDGNSF